MQLELITKQDLLPIKEDLKSVKRLLENIAPQKSPEQFYTRAGLCKLLSISENTLKTLELPYFKLGNSYRYDIIAVRKHLNLDTK
jgi:hypothetical protein